jgi:hypothetical protein
VSGKLKCAVNQFAPVETQTGSYRSDSRHEYPRCPLSICIVKFTVSNVMNEFILLQSINQNDSVGVSCGLLIRKRLLARTSPKRGSAIDGPAWIG